MTPAFWYKRSTDYLDILHRESGRKCLEVVVLYAFLLLDLRDPRVKLLTFDPKKVGEEIRHDSVIAFAVSAKSAGLPLVLCNEEVYGYFTPSVVPGEHPIYERLRMDSLRLEVLLHQVSA